MSKRLGDEDRRAVDLLLDKSLATAGREAAAYAAPGHLSSERTESVAKVLAILGAMPAFDPPADLMTRTLRRVEESAAAPAFAPDLASTRPTL